MSAHSDRRGSVLREARYRPGSYPSTPVPRAPMLHLLERFSYGVTPDLVAEATAAGGRGAWFEAQLSAAALGTSDGVTEAVADWWPDLHLSPVALWNANTTRALSAAQVMLDYANRALARRILSPRPVFERLAESMEDHLHVPLGSELSFPFRPGYGDLVRSLCTGRFEDLLVGALQHPAMLIYLNAAGSTRAHPNENLARELLELHTVGAGVYSEDDVKATARLLTGYVVDPTTGQLRYQSAAHDVAPVSILGFTDPNSDPDGRPAYTRLLRYLAHHPATARTVATRLARRFVREDPPAALIDRLAGTYLRSDTALIPVLRALVASPEFVASAGQLVRDPGEDVVATLRALRVRLTQPVGPGSAANLLTTAVAQVGTLPFAWPSPDGAPQATSVWASPARAAGSLQLHARLAALNYPPRAFPDVAEFLPPLPLPFRDLVDHLHRLLLQRCSTSAALRACCEATGLAPATTITADHPVVGTGSPALLAALLDQPAAYQR